MYKLHLKINALPKSLNRALGANRWARNRSNNAWDQIVLAHVGWNKPQVPLQKARIRIVRHFYRTLDYDGLVGSMKPVVDALVTAGVLSSDSWNVLGVWEVTQEFRPKKDGPLITIELSEA